MGYVCCGEFLVYQSVDVAVDRRQSYCLMSPDFRLVMGKFLVYQKFVVIRKEGAAVEMTLLVKFPPSLLPIILLYQTPFYGIFTVICVDGYFLS